MRLGLWLPRGLAALFGTSSRTNSPTTKSRRSRTNGAPRIRRPSGSGTTSTSAAVLAVRERGRAVQCGRIELQFTGAFLQLRLPSGRKITLSVAADHRGRTRRNYRVVFADNAAGQFKDCRNGQGAYGGTWTENVVQGIARDLLTEAMLRDRSRRLPDRAARARRDRRRGADRIRQHGKVHRTDDPPTVLGGGAADRGQRLDGTALLQMKGDVVLDDKPSHVSAQSGRAAASRWRRWSSGSSGWGGAGDGRGEKLYFVASEPQRPASLTDRSTWCDHATAVAAWQAGHADGIAYVMTEADPFAAIELVHCRHRNHALDRHLGTEFPRRGAPHLYGSDAERRRLHDLGFDRRRHRSGASEIHG